MYSRCYIVSFSSLLCRKLRFLVVVTDVKTMYKFVEVRK